MFTCLLKDRIKGTDGHPHGEGAQNLIGTRYVCVCVCACVCMCVGTYMYAFVSSLYKMADGIGTVFCWETWVTPLFSVYWEIN